MATPKPGEIRCPTCHRSTPPAAFCTQCGSAIPPDARIRPRGLDREELQERIRARRSGGDPYRRGAAAGLGGGEYERFEPEPTDTAVRRAPAAAERRRDLFDEASAPAHAAPVRGPSDDRRDLTREREDWGAPTPLPPPGVARPTPLPTHAPVHDDPVAADARYAGADDAPHYDEPVYDEAAYAGTAYDEHEYPYEDQDWDEPRDRGAGAFAILGFLALGVLALIGGAVLAGVFSGDPQTGAVGATSSPTLTAAPIPTDDATPDATTAAGTPAPALTAEPRETGEPVVFPDGFTAEAQPCIPGSADLDGCDSNAAVNSGAVDIWIGFRNGTENDVIGAELIGPDGTAVGEGSIPLERIGCSPTCPGGWTYFPFGNLTPGTYEVRITRNGQPAGETSFEVS